MIIFLRVFMGCDIKLFGQLTVELLEALFKSKNPISLLNLIILLKRRFSSKWNNGGVLGMYCNSDILPKFDKKIIILYL